MKKIKWTYILSAIVFLYLLLGVFPFARIETDSMAIANACQHIIDTSMWAENRLGHSYHMQSGTYFLIIVLSKLFHIPTFIIYSILTVIAWILFLFFTIRFISKISPLSNIFLLALILIMFPEYGSLGYYANSAALAGAFYMISFNVALKPDKFWKIILTGFLLGLAAWFRVDVAFAYPAVLFVLYFHFKDFKKSLLYSSAIALITIPVTLLLMHLMNAHVSGFLGYTEGHWQLFGAKNNLGLLDKSLIRAHISYFPLATLFLVVAGFWAVIKKKQWQVAGLWFFGVIFYYLLGINNNVAPKHLSYFLPFWSVIALYGIHFISSMKNKKRLAFAVLSVLVAFQFLIGFKVSFKNLPYADKSYSTLYPEPEIFCIARLPGPVNAINHIDLVLGTGTLIPTADEITPSSGIFFNPLNWHAQKKKLADAFNGLQDYIRQAEEDTLYFLITDGSTQFTINALMSSGYRWQENLSSFDKEPYKFIFTRSKQTAILYRFMGFRKFDSKSFTNIFQQMPVNEYVAVFLWDWQNYMMKERNQEINFKSIGSNSYLIENTSPYEED